MYMCIYHICIDLRSFIICANILNVDIEHLTKGVLFE